ncbi:MAG: DUF192 domain-containing protein [Elusimicrobiota bacterium]|jgi:uncharacterized membrane protein (UPF0127 family)|nr:DUF192 domain-containing protein [Elusimicrobiota bacterium]
MANLEMEFGIKIVEAKTFAQRFLGFMFKSKADYAVLFIHCKSIHTFFMRFNLDIVFLDKNFKVLAVKKNVKPWRLVFGIKNCTHILEIPSSV